VGWEINHCSHSFFVGNSLAIAEFNEVLMNFPSESQRRNPSCSIKQMYRFILLNIAHSESLSTPYFFAAPTLCISSHAPVSKEPN
jgi:hypothetical protein